MTFIKHFGMAIIGFTTSMTLLRNGISFKSWAYWIIVACVITAFIMGVLIGVDNPNDVH